MSFRERSAWITLVTVLACFGVYFGGLATGRAHRGFEAIHLLLMCVTALVVLQVGLHMLSARLSGRGDRAVRDEREAMIQARSHTVGYYVLIACVLALGIPGHLGHGAVDLMNFALLGVVIAVLSVSAAQIVMFRRGA